MTELKIPDGFFKIINDFVNDILITFPEYTNVIQKWWNLPMCSEKLVDDATALTNVLSHCTRIFPERFFDILNQNEDIFNKDSVTNTEFLPGIVFSHLWRCEITVHTRETIWKYLQLILFAIIGTINDPSELGDTAKIFENMDEELLKTKLSETMAGMQSMFEKTNTDSEGGDKENPQPTAEDIHSHLNDIMKGKLGKIAMEFAEETAEELNLNMNDNSNPKDVFQQMFKNPGNLMNVVKNVGTKLEKKIKSGEIKESEIISEGMEIMNKMKNMPGMENIQNMFSQMGLGKNSKLNMNAMESQMAQNLKMAKMRERMKKKAEETAAHTTLDKNTSTPTKPCFTDSQLESLFNTKPTSNKLKKKKTKK